jgi:hypothetical protein
MGRVAAGGTITLRGTVSHATGLPADAADLSLTIVDPVGAALAGFPMVIGAGAIVRDALGTYHYVWTVAADATLGDYTATWTGTVDGYSIPGEEIVEVLAAGTITTAMTVTDLRTFIDSGLPDTSLQSLLTSALDAIDDALGPLTCHERIDAGRGDLIMLSHEADAITSIVEDARWSAVTLDPTDYELSDTGMLLYRLRTGPNPRWRWHGRVDVTYVRPDDTAERVRVAVALVQLDLNHAPGLASQQIGTWQEAYRTDQDYAAQRDAILASLGSGPGIF